ncbi:MAG TPA: DUF6596 domain-containing protein [Candidatus Dormibacteraeota bacterium]|nr:DUF6596 domain-containing protein [Candidatus Dormibacteraeota bacterium]
MVRSASGAAGHGNQLQGPETATTVVLRGGQPIVKDGLFMEGKEIVGGYTEVEAADLDEALEMAKAWPWRRHGRDPPGGRAALNPVAGTLAQAAAADVFREAAARVTAALIRRFGDFDLAEDCVQDAMVAALETWPRDGVLERPAAWLTTVATRRALNRLQRDERYREKLANVASSLRGDGEGDDRLRLILACCHPGLGREAQVALTLRAVAGFTTAELARAFVASEATIAQRLVRAKRKIAAAGIPFRIPSEVELGDRLTEILDVLYLIFNEGHLSTRAGAPSKRDLAEEAAWLARLVCRLLPSESEPMGLLALFATSTRLPPTWTATTCSMPRGARCCTSSGGARRRTPRSVVRWSSQRTPPNGRCSSGASSNRSNL